MLVTKVYIQGKAMHTSYFMCNCCLKDRQYDLRFLRFCKRATIQFCVLKPPLAIATIILHAHGKYNEGDWSADQGDTLIIHTNHSPKFFQGIYILRLYTIFPSR